VRVQVQGGSIIERSRTERSEIKRSGVTSEELSDGFTSQFANYSAAERIFIAVSDTGIGIARADLEHIFEPFWQVEQTISRKHSGTGLGLAITHSLVQMMQGNITVESKENKGSIFQVDLPRTISPIYHTERAMPQQEAIAQPVVPIKPEKTLQKK
jgi:signal transduction histidine kinase